MRWSYPTASVADLARDVGPHMGKRASQRRSQPKQSETQSPRRSLQGVFRSRGNSSLECSTESTTDVNLGVMNRVSEVPFGDCELWNDEGLYRDRAH